MVNRTTATLREILFDAIDSVKNKRMDVSEAKAISTFAHNIIQSAELELKYSQTVSRLDSQDQGISPGPIMLTSKKVANE